MPTRFKHALVIGASSGMGEALARRLAADGGRVAMVGRREDRLLEIGGQINEAAGDERALTTDGEPDVTLNGVTDWVYWEELWNRDSEGFWWSPEGDEIAFYHFDDSAVPVFVTELLINGDVVEIGIEGSFGTGAVHCFLDGALG